MKKNVVTVAVVAAILGGLILLNRFQPGRLPDTRVAASAEAAETIKEANAEEQRYAQAAPESETAQTSEGPAGTAAAPSAAPIEAPAPPEIPEIAMPEDAQRYLFETTKGFWILDVFPKWAPIGAARFEEAVTAGVYNDAGIFRVVPGFVIQFGIPGNPEDAATWSENSIQDEAVLKPNEKGTITFAKSSRPNSRTTQLFISLGDNRKLDQMGFSPFGKVVHGMDVVESINAEYGESPRQDLAQSMGSTYLRSSFPRLDFITRVTKIADTKVQ